MKVVDQRVDIGRRDFVEYSLGIRKLEHVRGMRRGIYLKKGHWERKVRKRDNVIINRTQWRIKGSIDGFG